MIPRKDSRLYNILIIEDNPGDYILIEDYIIEFISNPNLVHVRSLQEAKMLLAPGCTMHFDIVLLDLTLPDGDGSLLITEIVEICPLWPIIVLTGYTDFEFSVESLALGVSDYLLKDELNPSALYKSIIYNIERKRASTELEESQKRYSNLFHLSPDPTYVCDNESGRFLDVNDAAIRIYGYSQEEFLSRGANDLLPQNHSENSDSNSQYSAVDSKTALAKINRHRKKNGELFYVEEHTSEIVFQGTAARVNVVRDITERINYIKAIERQNEKFSEIAWIQSHVVRAPIARLMGLVDLIKHPASDEKLKTELLDYIFESATELDGIVREITLKTEEIDVNSGSLSNSFDQ